MPESLLEWDYTARSPFIKRKFTTVGFNYQKFKKNLKNSNQFFSEGKSIKNTVQPNLILFHRLLNEHIDVGNTFLLGLPIISKEDNSNNQSSEPTKLHGHGAVFVYGKFENPNLNNNILEKIENLQDSIIGETYELFNSFEEELLLAQNQETILNRIKENLLDFQHLKDIFKINKKVPFRNRKSLFSFLKKVTPVI